MNISVYKSGGRFVVDYYGSNGKRQRRYFDTEEKAKAEAKLVQDNADLADGSYASLSLQDRMRLNLLLFDMEKAHIPISALQKVLIQPQPKSAAKVEKALADAIRECIAAKRVAGRRSRYIDNLEYCLERFALGREKKPISEIKVTDIDDWLKKFTAAGYRSTLLNRLSTLFAFAQRRDWIDKNPCDKVERIHVEIKTPVILSPEDAEKLMHFVQLKHPRLLAWFVLALFCGIRPEECDKVQWEFIDIEAGTVRLDASVTKVRTRRIIHGQPNVSPWLKEAKRLSEARKLKEESRLKRDYRFEEANELKLDDLPISMVTRRNHLRDIRNAMGWPEWPKDVLRKTCASYLMTKLQDAGRVADELGNSPGVLLRHYRELASKAEAERFFQIMPKTAPEGRGPAKLDAFEIQGQPAPSGTFDNCLA